MTIVRASALSAVATAARLVSGLVIIKLVALFGGPEGLGKVGQLMSLTALLAVLASGGITTGIVKYVAEYHGNPEKLRRLLGAGMCYAMAAASVILCVTLLFSSRLALWLLDDIRYRSLIWVLAMALPVIAAGNCVIAIINGFMDVRRIAIIQVASAFLAIVLTAVLAFFFQLYGALLALVLGQASLLAVSLPMLRQSPYFDWHLLRLRFDRAMSLRLAKLSIMTLTSAVLPPFVNIWVRNHLAAQLSWQQVGYWQAVSKVSEAYLLFFTAAISTYYLPKFSTITDREMLKEELRSAFFHILPVVAIVSTLVYLMRDWVTLTLFSDRFLAAEPLYAPQLIGDVIKIASFILSYIMLAKAMTAVFLLSELFFSASYIGLVLVLTWQFGLIGAMYAFAINYAFYFAFTAVVARAYIRKLHTVVRMPFVQESVK